MQKPNIYKHFRIVASVLVCSLAITVGGSVQAQTNAGAITNMVVSVDPTNGDSYYVFSLNSGGTAEVIAFADDVIRVRFSYNGFWAKEEPMIAAMLGAWPTEPNTITDQGTNYLLHRPAQRTHQQESIQGRFLRQARRLRACSGRPDQRHSVQHFVQHLH